MDIGRAIKRRVRVVAAPAFFLAVVAYFGCNVTSGDHGLVAAAAREKLLAQAKQDLASAEKERDAWANKVSGLQANHIDADMLDEQTRAMLNMSQPSEVVLMYPDKDKLF
jgi:cell division protein FtsB